MKMKKSALLILEEAGLLVLAAFLFALSFPNFIYRWGFPILAYICLLPVFILVRRSGYLKCVIYGALYGAASYALYNFWLYQFNPVAFMVVPVIYTGFLMCVFPLLKWIDRRFPRYGFLFQVLLWMAFEVVGTRGFVGYSYGVLAYSQYQFLSLIGISDILGALSVTFFLAFPAAWLKEWWFQFRETGQKKPVKRLTITGLVFLVLFLSANTYGLLARVDYSDSPKWKVSLLQHNNNAWLKEVEDYRHSTEILLEQSRTAQEEDPDMIIWSETAFVPSINWHLKYREDRDKVDLVNYLLEELDTLKAEKEIPFLIGNNDSIKVKGKWTSYNAILLMDGSEVVDKYRKNHLVPFTEHFPYGKILPWLLEMIQTTVPSFYASGSEYNILESGDVKMAPLVCFEDTFPYLSRIFVNNGANVLVNLTNDSWSESQVCAIQHAIIAVFRAVENRRSLIRSTTGGFTCVVDPNGKITDFLEPFTQDILTKEVPVYEESSTIFTRTGIWFENLTLIAVGLLFAYMIISDIFIFIRKRKLNE